MKGPSEAGGCQVVARYIERWLDEGERSRLDLDQIGSHASRCQECHAKLGQFFRTVDLPESSYLRETIDELALSMLNLARAVIRDRPPDVSESEAAVLTITDPTGGSTQDNLASGHEMIEDAEDYTGSSLVGGTDLGEVRDLLSEAEGQDRRRVELALDLFRRVSAIECRYEAEAWNWIGALEYRRERLDEAEAAFLKLLSLQQGLEEVRAYAHCTLAYIFKQRGDLERAVRSARRSVVLAEEDGKDTYFGQFAELYFRLLRGASDDPQEAEEIFQGITRTDAGRARFRADMLAAPNAPVLEVFRESPLALSFPLDDATP